MNFYYDGITDIVRTLNSSVSLGLDQSAQKLNREKYGRNVLTKKKKQSFFSRIFFTLKEPMLIILLFGFIITLGTNIGRFFKSGEGDFSECIGILLAIIVSVAITLIMEGSSQKAFETLNKIYDNVAVKVVRSGRNITISQKDLLVGDIVLLESGDKIVADGRLVDSNLLFVDESALTGESVPVKKDYNAVLKEGCALADRVNFVFSGTFVTGGSGKMIVTAIGDKTEMGDIARELLSSDDKGTPLQVKLSKLGKLITIIGAISACCVLLISLIRLYLTNTLNFSNVQELFISCIVLIVAAVPEGLPTIVAISLALNMIKLAKSNALIKKMTATETTGAVSVICSDKTGTLTQNKMQVISICLNNVCSSPEKIKSEIIKQNFVINSTANVYLAKGKQINSGSATECALLWAYQKTDTMPYQEYRSKYKIIDREPFSSQTKMMSTTIMIGQDKKRILLKGSPEKILELCSITSAQKIKILKEISVHQKKAMRVICFAHLDSDVYSEKYVYDGYVSLADAVRKEVYSAVQDCRRAGIEIKILTGDNRYTAFAIAKELKIANDESQVVEASYIENLSSQDLKKILPKVKVVARSTPATKSKIVKALKEMGEVVALTGDGINDAPAIKHADVGIAMGISGSDITKETADIVLLDDSFATIVKAIAFGRNVYKNLQRFILFQLSVNLSSLLFILACVVMNLPSPFNTLQLLWINVIMDGPPALTLGLENGDSSLMKNSPVKREDSIVNRSMFLRIAFNGIFMATVMILQTQFNFMQLKSSEMAGGIFSLFIIFQLFNAFNSRELGSASILNGIGKNKIMVATFMGVFLLHLIIVQIFSPLFNVCPLSVFSWIKILLVAFSIVLVSEGYKWLYRSFRVKKT